MTVPPAFSTVSAITEVLVSAAVYWFFYHAWKRGNFRWGIITVAIVYETLFNISYMVSRILDHDGGGHDHPGWVTAFIAVHGTLSLVMFVGLIWYVLWVRRGVTGGLPNPVATYPRLAATFLWLWTISVASGEAIYAFYWLDVI